MKTFKIWVPIIHCELIIYNYDTNFISVTNMVLLSSDESVVYVHKDIKLRKILCSSLHKVDSDLACIYRILRFLHYIKHLNTHILVYINVKYV